MCSTCVTPISNASASHAEHNVLRKEFEFSLACSGGNVAVLEAKPNSVSSTVCMLHHSHQILLTAIHSVHKRYTALQARFIEIAISNICDFDHMLHDSGGSS